MAKVDRFEDLRCWQGARKRVKEIYAVSEDGRLSKDFATRDQLRRAALSVMNTIAEGFGKYSSTEFIRYLDNAQSSALEVRSMLYVVHDLDYIIEAKVKELFELVEETRSSCLALIKTFDHESNESNHLRYSIFGHKHFNT